MSKPTRKMGDRPKIKGPEDIAIEGMEPQNSYYKVVKALLEAQKKGTAIHIATLLDAVEGLVEEHETLFPQETQNYEPGQAQKVAIIRQLTSFKFIAPPKLKDQDRVEWGYAALKDFMTKVEDLTQGNVILEVEIPPRYR